MEKMVDCEKKYHVTSQMKRIPKTCLIKLSSLNNLSSKNNHSLYTQKICHLVNDYSYQKIFTSNQLNQVIGSFYDNQNKDLLKPIPENTTPIQKSNVDRIVNKNIKDFARRVKKCIDDDIRISSRYDKTKISYETKPFRLTPIKLYQHSLLAKYCQSQAQNTNSPLKIDCKLLGPASLNYVSQPHDLVTAMECSPNNLQSLTPLITLQKIRTIKNISEISKKRFNTGISIKTVTCDKYTYFENSSFIKKRSGALTSKISSAKPSHLDTKHEEIPESKSGVIKEDNISVTKSNYHVSAKPRLSKENIQGLIRQSLTNVMNKKKKHGERALKLKRPRSSTSESQYFSESGDNENSTSGSSLRFNRRYSLDTTDAISNDSQLIHTRLSFKEPSNRSLTDSYDMTINESDETVMAIRESDYVITLANRKEQRTMSGFFVGFNKGNIFSNQRFNFDGNYGYIDGVNLKSLVHKTLPKIEHDKLLNETFSALSHMYSLKKLMERKSMVTTTKTIASPSFSLSTAFVQDDKHGDEDGFTSESSGEISLIESYLSFDRELAENFKQKRN